MNALRMILASCLFAVGAAHAQLPVVANADHEKMLSSADPKLAANKRLVYDLWREVLEAQHLELADKYLAESYMQHNPNVPTGRAGFVQFFGKFAKPQPIEAKIKGPLVGIVAEGDYVVLSFVREAADPADAAKKYTTTHFDMFRIENGKVAEHWDSAAKR